MLHNGSTVGRSIYGLIQDERNVVCLFLQSRNWIEQVIKDRDRKVNTGGELKYRCVVRRNKAGQTLLLRYRF